MQFDLAADDGTDATEPVAPGTSCTTGGGCEYVDGMWICIEPP